MNQKKQLTIMEFACLTGIKRENLRFYDRIGLLSPDMRGENNYRYYSRRQLSVAYLIGTLRGLGVGIAPMKQYLANRTPENTLSLFAQQDARIQAEIRQLRETRRMMSIYSSLVHRALSHGPNALFLEEKKREDIFLCPPIPAGMDDDEGGLFSYEYAEAHGVNLAFPQGTLLDGGSLTSARYYFKVGAGGNAHKPAGLYAVAYEQCDTGNAECLSTRLLRFITTQDLRVCGDAYEEYPLGDIAVEDREPNCIRLEIPVEKCSD